MLLPDDLEKISKDVLYFGGSTTVLMGNRILIVAHALGRIAYQPMKPPNPFAPSPCCWTWLAETVWVDVLQLPSGPCSSTVVVLVPSGPVCNMFMLTA